MVSTKSLEQGIILPIGFGRVMRYPTTFQVIEPNVFLGQPIRGIANVLCNFEDEQYPSMC